MRERIQTPDGDVLDLDWALHPEGEDPRRPLVLLLHGLEGSARSGYARETYGRLHAHGLDGVGLNFRSCSGEPNLRPRLYHSGETTDAELVLARLAQRYPGRALGAVGFSLGGNVLVVHLGSRGNDSVIQAAVAVSVPFDLAAGTAALERPFARHVYVRALLGTMQAKVRARAAELRAAGADVERALAATGFWQFDDAVTAPLHGFAGADDYYARCSSGQFVSGIRRPTLLIQAEDDPFVPTAAIPRQAIAANSHIEDAIQTRGGHVGFLGGPIPLRPRFWAEDRAAEFLAVNLGGSR